MPHSMYWLDVDGDRHGLEIAINGIPAERLLKTHGIRFPINEYLVSGQNLIEVRRSLWLSNLADDQPGEVAIKLIHAQFSQAVKLSEVTILEQRAEFLLATPRSVLLSARFASDMGGRPFWQGFDPIGPSDRAKILDTLERVTGFWRRGDGDQLAQWMSGYIADYATAYPLERNDTIASRVRRMAESFKSERAEFDRGSVLLDPIAGCNLLDCIGPNGAAVRVNRANGSDYNMWAVVGMKNGTVHLVR